MSQEQARLLTVSHVVAGLQQSGILIFVSSSHFRGLFCKTFLHHGGIHWSRSPHLAPFTCSIGGANRPALLSLWSWPVWNDCAKEFVLGFANRATYISLRLVSSVMLDLLPKNFWVFKPSCHARTHTHSACTCRVGVHFYCWSAGYVLAAMCSVAWHFQQWKFF